MVKISLTTQGNGKPFPAEPLPITTKVIDMKRLQFITMVCILYVTASCTTQKPVYRERLEEAKGYALYACIAHMNKFVDSTSVIPQIRNYAPNMIQKRK